MPFGGSRLKPTADRFSFLTVAPCWNGRRALIQQTDRQCALICGRSECPVAGTATNSAPSGPRQQKPAVQSSRSSPSPSRLRAPEHQSETFLDGRWKRDSTTNYPRQSKQPHAPMLTLATLSIQASFLALGPPHSTAAAPLCTASNWLLCVVQLGNSAFQ